MMNKTRITLCFALFLWAAQVNATTYTTILAGDWTDMATWTGNTIPPPTIGASDIVTINHAVAINTNLINNGIINVNVNSNLVGTFSLQNNKTLNIAGMGTGTTLTINAHGEFFNNAPDGTINMTGTSMATSSLNLSAGSSFTNFDAINVGAYCSLYASEIFENSGTILFSGTDAQIVMNADILNTATGIIQLDDNANLNLDAGILYNSGALNLLCPQCNVNITDATIENEDGGIITGNGKFLDNGGPGTPFLTNATGSKVNPGTDTDIGFLSSYQYTFGASTLKCKIKLDDLSSDYLEILDVGTIDNANSKLAVHFIGTGTVAPGDEFLLVSTITSATISGTFNFANVTVTGGNVSTWHLSQTTTEIKLVIDAVLPIELLNFIATTEGAKNHLTWTTASETNNKGFDIERSRDGETFQSIGTVKAIGKAGNYNFTDAEPVNGTNYYRLRQIDFDGTETFSKVVSVANKGGKSLKVYPTLVSNGILTVDTEGGDYAIYNVFGQQVQSGKTAQRLDVSALAKGTYILKVSTEQAKFVKQ